MKLPAVHRPGTRRVGSGRLFTGAARERRLLTVEELQRALSIVGEMVDLDCDGRLSAQIAAEELRGE